MSLTLIATPIGNDLDLGARAQALLREADLVIGEEHREVTTLLKKVCGERRPEHRVLNEHSKPDEIDELLELCRKKSVVLVSDCGTPGFCDPGAPLVAKARAEHISVTTVPGPSALMGLISVSGVDLRRFVFFGFLSAENELRRREIQDVAAEKRAVILMDTPYRLSKLLKELAAKMPKRQAVLTCNLTQPTERIEQAPLTELAQKFSDIKAEFMLLLLPEHRP